MFKLRWFQRERSSRAKEPNILVYTIRPTKGGSSPRKKKIQRSLIYSFSSFTTRIEVRSIGISNHRGIFERDFWSGKRTSSQTDKQARWTAGLVWTTQTHETFLLLNGPFKLQTCYNQYFSSSSSASRKCYHNITGKSLSVLRRRGEGDEERKSSISQAS